MAAFNKFESFVGALGLGYHGNLNTNRLDVALKRGFLERLKFWGRA